MSTILKLFPILLAMTACSRRDQVKDDADKIIAELRQNVRFLTISRGAPQLKDLSPVASYVLTLTERPSAQSYLFELKEYTLQTGGDPDKIFTHDLCEVIDRLYDADTASVERYVKGVELHGGLDGVVGELGAGLNLGFPEALHTIMKMKHIRNSHVLVAIKGYADGQHGPWTDTLRADYRYDSIGVLPPTTNSENPTSYFLRDSIIRIPSRRYSNSLLPDLRAEFIRQVLVLPYLENCELTPSLRELQTDVRILKGFEYTKADHPENRKVQVFLYIFDSRLGSMPQ